MRDMIIAATVLLVGLGTASAEGRRIVQVRQSSCHAAPVVQPYAAPVVQQIVHAAPFVQHYPATVAYQPIAVYVVPGTPTAALNVYPGALTVIQPIPVQIQVNPAPATVAPSVTVPAEK